MGCAFRVLVLWCAVLCCVVMCGVGVQCVVSVVCVRGVCRVCGAARHAEKILVCRFKTPPCVPAKRAHVFNMPAFCQYTRKRFEPTHGDVFNLQTRNEEGREGSLLSLSALVGVPVLVLEMGDVFVFGCVCMC